MYELKNNIKAVIMLIYLLLSKIFFNFAKIFFKPKVYDCFIFMNEIELLELRIEELKDTHKGKIHILLNPRSEYHLLFLILKFY